jgi:hypothetical protein
MTTNTESKEAHRVLTFACRANGELPTACAVCISEILDSPLDRSRISALSLYLRIVRITSPWVMRLSGATFPTALPKMV